MTRQHGRASIPPRPSNDEASSCDWGGCDAEGEFWRWADDLGYWLPVCRRHSTKADRALVPPAWNSLYLRRCRGHWHISTTWICDGEPDDVDLSAGMQFEAASAALLAMIAREDEDGNN